jgi:hypothetical protein
VIQRYIITSIKKLSVAIAGISKGFLTCTLRNRMHPTKIELGEGEDETGLKQ